MSDSKLTPGMKKKKGCWALARLGEASYEVESLFMSLAAEGLSAPPPGINRRQGRGWGECSGRDPWGQKASRAKCYDWVVVACPFH
jgi:hypothetical protein